MSRSAGEIAAMAEGLSEGEREALVPFTFFSNAIGARLVAKGLLAESDGVFTHTKLGLAVRAHLQTQKDRP